MVATLNSTFAFASDNELADVEQLDLTVSSEFELSVDNVRSLAFELCALLTSVRMVEGFDVRKEYEKRLQSYSGVDTEQPDYQLKLAEFWSLHSEMMICRAASGAYPKQHFFKRVIEMNLQRAVLDEYFLYDEIEFPIDVNAIEIEADGSQTTVLDYVDKVLATPSLRARIHVGQVTEIRDILVELYGGKKAREMTPSELRIRSERFKRGD